MIGHHWDESDKHGSANDKEGFKPILRFFDVNALKHGHTHPPSWKVYLPGIDHDRVIPVNHYGDSGDWTYIVKRPSYGKVIDIYFTETPSSDLFYFPDLQKTSVTLGDTVTMLRTPAVFGNGKLHLVCVKKELDRSCNNHPPRYSVRVIRIPIEIIDPGLPGTTPQPQASIDPVKGFIDDTIGTIALEDAEGDLVSCELPAIAVNRYGHMLIVYGRVGVDTADPLGQEARYSVWYDDVRGLQHSNILKAGETLLTSSHTCEIAPGSYMTELAPTATSYHDHPFVVQSVNADVDPMDDESIWMIHTYANLIAGHFRTVVGKVKPTPLHQVEE
jgi:hypothetical protein